MSMVTSIFYNNTNNSTKGGAIILVCSTRWGGLLVEKFNKLLSMLILIVLTCYLGASNALAADRHDDIWDGPYERDFTVRIHLIEYITQFGLGGIHRGI